jgi:hypothetical protein
MKAENSKSAKAKTEVFMDEYRGDVWDWYQIGGRWTGTLDGYDPQTDPANKKHCWLCDGSGIRDDTLGKQMREKDPSYTCNGCKGTGEMDKWPTEYAKRSNDILPLELVIPIILEEWQQDPIKEGKAEESRAKEWLNGKRGKDNYNMYGYVLSCAAKLYQQEFSFECNIFNIESYNFALPEDYEGWWAVIVDMHN